MEGGRSNPSTRCFVELNVLGLPSLFLLLEDSFSHTFLCLSRACGLKVRLQMVQGNRVDWLSSGYSVGTSVGLVPKGNPVGVTSSIQETGHVIFEAGHEMLAAGHAMVELISPPIPDMESTMAGIVSVMVGPKSAMVTLLWTCPSSLG